MVRAVARSKIPAPRKRPRRRNAKQTVEAILEATAQLLASGIEAANTNAIAKRAGVSVGSVYQYFPNREAIIRELAGHQWERALERMAAVVRTAESTSLTELTRHSVAVLASSEQGAAKLRRTLLLHVPRAWLREVAEPVHRSVTDHVQTLMKRGGNAGSSDAERAHLRAFVLTHAIQGVVDATLIEHPEWLDGEDAGAGLREELTKLALAYLGSGEGAADVPEDA